jgi:hypothetical protein
MDISTFALSLIGGSAGGIAVVAFLGKRFIELQLSLVLERYKTELEEKSAVLKTHLSIYAHEQSVGISRLDAQRSKAIEVIYAFMNQWNELFEKITRPDEELTSEPEAEFNRYYELAEKLGNCSRRLSVAIHNRAIYFDQTAYARISRYGSEVTQLGTDYFERTFGDLDMTRPAEYEQAAKSIREAGRLLREAGENRLGELRESLLTEFRRLMKAEN